VCVIHIIFFKSLTYLKAWLFIIFMFNTYICSTEVLYRKVKFNMWRRENKSDKEVKTKRGDFIKRVGLLCRVLEYSRVYTAIQVRASSKIYSNTLASCKGCDESCYVMRCVCGWRALYCVVGCNLFRGKVNLKSISVYSLLFVSVRTQTKTHNIIYSTKTTILLLLVNQMI
jgi:hypothetical protein